MLLPIRKIKKGYTLIEVVISLGLISTLFLLGYFSYRSYINRQIFLSSVRTFEDTLKTARSLAFNQEKPPGCTLKSYTLVLTPPRDIVINRDCVGQTAVLVKSVVLDPGVSFFAPVSSISFKPLGQGTSLVNDVIVSFSQGSANSATLTVNRSGETSL